jgi:RNA-directed DNA polymerase
MDLYAYLGYKKSDLILLAGNLPKYYITYKILKKSGKTRRIDAPQPPLKEVQKEFLNKVLYLFRAHPIAHGFVKDKSPITNANAHIGKKIILTIDVKNFFNSISEQTVSRCLEWLFGQQTKFTWDSTDPVLFAKLLCYNGGLPQGSSASPVMSNLVCLSLDKKLASLAAANDLTITRYADDITLSCNDDKVLMVRHTVYQLLNRYGLVPNKAKTKVRRYFQRQQVTGIVVNTQLGTKKEMWRNVRAKLHNLKRDGKTLTPLEFQQVRGVIEWIRSLNPQRGNQLIGQLSTISVKT